jgi:uncharacterized membrane protein
MLASFLFSQGAGKLADMVKGKAANMAVDAIADKLGVERNEKSIEDHLRAHPEEMVKLEQLNVEKLALEIQDRENAREMQREAMKSDDPWVRRFVYLFAWFWAVTSVGYFFAVTFLDVPKTGEQFANFILGFLTGTAVATIIGFFYGGASKGDDK